MKVFTYKLVWFLLCSHIYQVSFCQGNPSTKTPEYEKIAYLIKGEQVRSSTKFSINDFLYDFDCMNLLLKSKEKLSFELITDSIQKQRLSGGCSKVKTLIRVTPVKKFQSDFNRVVAFCKPYIFLCKDKATETLSIEDLLEQLAKFPIDAS